MPTFKRKVNGKVNLSRNAFGLGALKIKQSKFGLRAPIAWWNKGIERVLDERYASWSELLEDDIGAVISQMRVLLVSSIIR